MTNEQRAQEWLARWFPDRPSGEADHESLTALLDAVEREAVAMLRDNVQ